jgi:hypothetical protein
MPSSRAFAFTPGTVFFVATDTRPALAPAARILRRSATSSSVHGLVRIGVNYRLLSPMPIRLRPFARRAEVRQFFRRRSQTYYPSRNPDKKGDANGQSD